MAEYVERETILCPRCGYRRRINPQRQTTYCLDCVTVMRRITDNIDPEPIEWVRRGVIWHGLSTDETVQNSARDSDTRLCRISDPAWVA